MSTQVTPMWKMRISDCLRRSNKVNLSGEDIDSLEKIGTYKLMVQLDLSYVRTIHSFEGFKHQPALKTLIADGSAISSLKNVSSLSNITAISLKNTPLLKSNQKFNVLASLILVIPELRIFNGKVISQKTRTKVESAGYPMPQTASLIDAGWIVEYPCPSKREIIELLKQYEIYNENSFEEEEEEANDEIEEADQDEKDKDSIENQNADSENNDKNSSNDNVLNRSVQDDNKIENSEEMIQNKKTASSEQNEKGNDYDEMEYSSEKNENENENEYEDENENDNNNDTNENDNENSEEYDNPFHKPIREMSLLEKVVMVLMSNGYKVDPNNMQQSVLNTIDSLCSEVEQMNSSIPSEQSSQT